MSEPPSKRATCSPGSTRSNTGRISKWPRPMSRRPAAELNAQPGTGIPTAQLLKNGHATRADYDHRGARLQDRTGAGCDAARAKQVQASENLGYTELKADDDGIITAVGADAGPSRQRRADGRSIGAAGETRGGLQCRRGGSQKPAERPRRRGQAGQQPRHQDGGKVRYVSPQADPATRTFTVRVSLPDAPPQMRLGATVSGKRDDERDADHQLCPAARCSRRTGNRRCGWSAPTARCS